MPKRRLEPLAAVPLMVALAACSTSTTSSSNAPDRQAAAISESPEPHIAESGDSSSPATQEPTSSIPLVGSTAPSGDPLAAGVKSTNVCVDNQSGVTLSVTFTTYDTRQRDTSELRNNVKTCAEGTFIGKPDVTGTVAKAGGGETVSFAARNYMMGYPQLQLGDKSGRCGYYDPDFGVGNTRVADDGNLRFTVTRDPDTNWKQFRITVSPTQGRVWQEQIYRGGLCGEIGGFG